jgi:DNA-binding MarR family transcriptional regulator
LPAARPRPAAPDDQIAALAAAMRDLQRLRASRRVHAALTDATGVDLSQQAIQVLAALDGTQTVAEVARAARMDVGAVSRQLRALEDEGYVTKTPSRDHASVVLVAATRRGRDLAERVAASRNDHLARALEHWSTSDRRALASLLRRLVDDLQSTPYSAEAHVA